MIKIAIVGLGYIGKVHLETLLRIPGVKVVALAGRRLGPLEDLAVKHAIPTVTSDYRTLLEDSSIDVIHNCTPNHMHFQVNHDFINAGKHVFSEKPLARTSQETRALLELAKAKDVLTAINFCYRYYPAVQEAAVRIRNEELGKVYTVMGSYLQDWLLYDTDYDWRLEQSVAGDSNVIADIGSHWFHLAQFMVGSRITEVMADLKTTLPIRKKPEGEDGLHEFPVEVEDYGSVLLHFANGASGVFTVSQLAAGKKCAIDVQVYGSQSALQWNHERSTELWIGHRDRANEVLMESPQLQQGSSKRYALLPTGHPMGYYDAVFNLFTDFYHALALKKQGKESPVALPDFNEGHRELLITEAILKSQREKKWVQVGE